LGHAGNFATILIHGELRVGERISVFDTKSTWNIISTHTIGFATILSTRSNERHLRSSILESNRAVCDERRAELGHTMRKGELQVGGEDLLDVWAAEILGLLDLDDTEDLVKIISPCAHQPCNKVSIREST